MKRLLLFLLFLFFSCLPLQAQWLQEDTAKILTFWLFNTADSTPKTGVTVSDITIRYVKSDATTASFTCGTGSIDGSGNDCLEKGNGAYVVEVTAAQLDTAGMFELGCSMTGGVCAPTTYQILPTASYSLLAGGNVASGPDLWNVATSDVTAGIGLQIKTNLDIPVSYGGGIVTSGVAQAGGTNTITLATTAPSVPLINKSILLTYGTGNFQSGIITAYNTGTKVATVQDGSTGGNWTTQPTSGTGYVIYDASVGALVDNIISAAKIATDAITAAKIAAGAIGASEAPSLANLDAAVSTRASQTSLDTTAGYVDTEVAAIKTKTDFLPSATAGSAGGVFIAGTNAATTVTTAFITTFTGNLTGSVASVTGAVGSVTGSVGGNVGGNVTGNVTGTIGGLTAAALKDFFDTDTTTTYASAVAGSVVKEITDNSGGAGFTVQNIVDGVWNEATSGHQTAGTTGKALTDASSAGDPWTSALSGYTTPGTAGYVLNTNLNATVTSRASQTSVDDVQTDTNDIQTRLPAALVSGRMDSSVGAMASNVITAAAINADAFTAAKFAADVSTEFAATLMATTFEGSNTFKHFLQYGAAALFGKYNSSSGTFNFRDLADTKNRIVYTTSSTARTSVTLSPD